MQDHLDFTKSVERWGVFSLSVNGPSEGNPFVEQSLKAEFQHAQESITADGFYDGDGRYIVRFMPRFTGEYRFILRTSWSEKEENGSFTVTQAREENHGPVHVAGMYHFAYEDGTPYYSIGTTCYVWNLQSDEQIAQTLESLKNSAFNKIRFCIFPKHYDYNLKEPRSYPYEGTPMDSSVLTPANFMQYQGKSEGNHWDFYRFNPEHFRHLEYCIERLGELGIEADLIVMHPYDRWGFSTMEKDQDDLYWRYVIARLAAYRNIWWSLANEYDLMQSKTVEDWERYASILCEKDPYGHLRSIHNCHAFYDHTRPWITHCSIQRQNLYLSSELVKEWRERFQKPIVLDEIAYEGNIQHGWGNITAEEMTRRFWECAVRGGYPGHSETYMHPEDILWWSHGGKLHGESHKRFKLLLDILKENPYRGLRPYERSGWDAICAVPDTTIQSFIPVKDFYLFYYSFMRPSFREFYFDDSTRFTVKVIDTWNMTVEDRGVKSGAFRIDLPAKQYMAIMIKKAE